MNTEEPVIILADDLAPSETVQLDKDKVLSFVTVHGSVIPIPPFWPVPWGSLLLSEPTSLWTDRVDGSLL